MKRTWAGLAIVAAMVAVGCGKGGGEAGAATGGGQASEVTAVVDVRAVLDRYVKAVNEADEKGVHELLAEPDNVSFISPMQRMKSWDELQGFWQGFLKNTFKERDLKPSNVAVHASGDAAWAVFDWEFNATMMDGKPFQSRGWETHVYRRTERGWRIGHIHYSAAMTPPPAGGKTEP